jgi:hypothetical protein
MVSRSIFTFPKFDAGLYPHFTRNSKPVTAPSNPDKNIVGNNPAKIRKITKRIRKTFSIIVVEI